MTNVIRIFKKIKSDKATTFEKVGNAHNDLISLLKEKSPIFKENIGKIVSIYILNKVNRNERKKKLNQNSKNFLILQ